MSGFIRYVNKRFNYYNAPEGVDPVSKLIGLGQYGFWTGTFIGLYDAVLWSHCANAPQFFNTYGYWVVPLTGMCFSFSAVTYSLTNLRKKDDKWNYIAGALSSGSILYAWQKDIRLCAWGTVFLVFYAALKKQNIEDGFSRKLFMPEDDPVNNRKWLFAWRNLEYRDYTSAPWFPHDKTDYYKNHY